MLTACIPKLQDNPQSTTTEILGLQQALDHPPPAMEDAALCR